MPASRAKEERRVIVLAHCASSQQVDGSTAVLLYVGVAIALTAGASVYVQYIGITDTIELYSREGEGSSGMGVSEREGGGCGGGGAAAVAALTVLSCEALMARSVLSVHCAKTIAS